LVDGDGEGGWDDMAMAMAILSLNLFLKWDNGGACLLKHVTSCAIISGKRKTKIEHLIVLDGGNKFTM